MQAPRRDTSGRFPSDFARGVRLTRRWTSRVSREVAATMCSPRQTADLRAICSRSHAPVLPTTVPPQRDNSQSIAPIGPERAVEEMLAVFLTLDKQGCVIDANRTAQELFEFDSDWKGEPVASVLEGVPEVRLELDSEHAGEVTLQIAGTGACPASLSRGYTAATRSVPRMKNSCRCGSSLNCGSASRN